MIMDANTKNTVIYNTQTRETQLLSQLQAHNVVTSSRGLWSFKKPPAAGFDRELPVYRLTRDLIPPEKARFRSELPFAHIQDNSVWQYADREYKAGEIVETDCWPHGTMVPINESARRTLAVFNTSQKSRLPHKPFRGGRLQLDDGLGATFGYTPPPLARLQPVNMSGGR